MMPKQVLEIEVPVLPPPEAEVVTIAEAAAQCGVSERTIRRLVENQQVQVYELAPRTVQRLQYVDLNQVRKRFSRRAVVQLIFPDMAA